MANFTDETPSEFKDEERWLKFFPKRVFLTLCVLIVIGIIVTRIINLIFGIFWPVLIVWLIGCAVVAVLMMIPTSSDDVMRGGGQDVMSVLIKKRYRKKMRSIGIKGISNKN